MPSSPPPEPAAAPGARRAPHPALLAALVAVLAAAVFAPAVGGGYILDDQQLIQNNPLAHSLSHWARWFSTDFWDQGNAILNLRPRVLYYRPLVSASYAIDWAIGHGSPVVFHLTNLAWHAAASALAFLALRRWLGDWRPALLLSLLVAVHPTRSESVAWISGRTDVMCAVWMLLASTGIAMRLRGKRAGIAVEAAATVASYLTKELAIVLPAFAAIEIWVSAGRPPLDMRLARTILRGAAPQIVLAAAYLLLRQFVLPMTKLTGSNSTLHQPATHLVLVLETFGRAMALVFFPRHLTIDEGPIRIVHGRFLYSTPYVVLGVALLLAIAAVILSMRRRAPGVVLGTAFFLLTFLPTSNVALTRLTTVISDRFLYVPLLGVALALGRGAMHVPRSWWKGLGGLAVAMAALFAWSSAARARDFGDERRFWNHEAALDPDSQTAAANRIRLAFADRDYQEAFRRSVQTYELAQKYYSYIGYEVYYALVALDALARLTPDANAPRLRALATFYGELLDPGRKAARLDLPELGLVLDLTQPRTQARLRESRPQILVARADLLSRLGDDEQAAALAKRAIAQCVVCKGVASRAAIVLARAADYADARATVAAAARTVDSHDAIAAAALLDTTASLHERSRATGPQGLIAHAKELSLLGAYGRAFAILRPHQARIVEVPDLLDGYAELAWRAGYPDVTRHVLAARIPPARIEALGHAWSRDMGWERPRPGDGTPTPASGAGVPR